MALTKRQAEILKLRSKGYTQREVAEIMRTTRENIAMLEKRAREVAEKALETLQNYLSAIAVFEESVASKENIEYVTRRIKEKGDKAGVRLRIAQPQLAEVLSILGAGRETIERPLKVYVLGDGTIVVIPANLRSLKIKRESLKTRSKQSGGPAGT